MSGGDAVTEEYTWEEAILLVLRDGQGRLSSQEMYERVGTYKQLDKGVRAEAQETANGRPHFHQTVRTIRTDLKKKGELIAEEGDYFSLTEAGRNRLASLPSKVVPYVGRPENSDVERGHRLHPDDADQTYTRQYEAYSPDGTDHREVAERQIRVRRGQQQFRDALRLRFADKCVVTGCGIVAILEAAHINPYRGDNDNHPGNGLLLRADIHTLFDLDLLGIEPAELRIGLHPTIITEYGQLLGIQLNCADEVRPSPEALTIRYEQFRLRIKQLG